MKVQGDPTSYGAWTLAVLVVIWYSRDRIKLCVNCRKLSNSKHMLIEIKFSKILLFTKITNSNNQFSRTHDWKLVLFSTELVHWVKEMDTSEWVFPRVYEGENPFPSVPFLSRMESSLVEDGILFHVAVMFSEWLFCFHGVKTTQEWVEQLPL